MATERVGIEIELMGADEAVAEIRRLEKELKSLGGRRKKIELESNIRELDRQIKGYRSELAKLRNEQRGMERGSGAWKTQAAEIRRVTNEMQAASAQAQRYKTALKNAAPPTIGQVFSRTSSRIGHIGSALQSAGNALERIATPMRLLTGGLGLGAGFAAISKVEEGLASGFQRHDIMRKYPKIMQRLGYSEEQAQKSLDKLDASVQGLPTGLDEIVDVAQRYTMALGDMDRGTDIAIAANNAFLASMSTDTQKYAGMMQLSDLINGKKLRTTEWESLISSMDAGINAVGKEFGYADDEMDDFRRDLKAGEIDSQKFLDALVKVGTGEGELVGMASESMDTWEAFSSRINSAFSRMTHGILTAGDELVSTLTHGQFESLNSFLDSMVIPKIDEVSESIQKWIRANPDKITGFFEKLKNFDWKGLGKGMLDGIKDIGKFFELASDKLGGVNAEKIGKFITLVGPLGSALTILGGVFKGLRHPFGIVAGAGSAIFGGSLLGNIGSLLSGIADLKGLKKAEKNLKTVEKISKIGGKSGGITHIFGNFVPLLEGIAGVGLATIEIAGTAAIDAKLLHIAVDNVTGIVNGMQDVFKGVKGLKKASSGINKGEVQTAVNDFFDIYSIIRGQETTASKGAKGLTKGAGGGQKAEGTDRLDKGYLKSMSDSITYMVDIFGTMKDLQSKLDALKGFTGFDEGTRTGIGNYIRSLGSIYDDMDQKLDNLKPDRVTEMASIVDTSVSMFDTFGDIAKKIPGIAKKLQNVTTSGRRTNSPMWIVKNALTGDGGLFSSLNEILTSLDGDAMGNGVESTGERFTSDSIGKLQTAMDGINTMFETIGSIADQIPTLQSKLQGFSSTGGNGRRESGLTQVVSMITGMMKELNRVTTAVNNIGDTGALVSNMDNLKKAITSVKGIATSLEGLGSGALASTDGGAFVAINNLKQMITQIGDALNVEAVAGIQAQVDAFKESIDSMFKSLNISFSNVKITVIINGQVKGADKLISEVNAAGRRIRMAVNGLPSNIYRTVNVHITPNVSTGTFSTPTFPTSGSSGGGRNLTRSSYRREATGGQIHGATGRDKVPTLLTSGEYVHQKRAVQYFGAEFMRRVNNLDVAGAMRALSARVGKSAVPRGTVINNNTTNNYNVNTNQNINTNNPHFAFKRSNRYVMAL